MDTTWRTEFQKACMERNLSLKVIASYTDQMIGKTVKEKAILAAQFAKEIKEKYPLEGETK